MDAKVDAVVNANLDANMNVKVEANMVPMVGVKLGTNCVETDVYATKNVEKDTKLDAKKRQTWIQNKIKKGM